MSNKKILILPGDYIGQEIMAEAVKVLELLKAEGEKIEWSFGHLGGAAYDAEFAQEASEFDTLDELREDVRERLTRGKRLEQAAAARDAVLEALLEKTEAGKRPVRLLGAKVFNLTEP